MNIYLIWKIYNFLKLFESNDKTFERIWLLQVPQDWRPAVKVQIFEIQRCLNRKGKLSAWSKDRCRASIRFQTNLLKSISKRARENINESKHKLFKKDFKSWVENKIVLYDYL